jgi:pimeloyl-ACP methyl ester carboxylesterase
MHVIDTGTGTPVVLLHGFGVDHRILLPLDPVIERGGWRRIYVDLPGHGGSAVRDVASTMGIVAAVEEEILARVDGHPFALIGNSYGGMIARYMAHHLRDRVLGLATVGAVFFADAAHRGLPARQVLSEDVAALQNLGEAADAYAAMAVVQTPDNANAFGDYVYPGIVAADQGALERIASRYSLAEEPELSWPAPFTQPSLFIAGRQDHVVGYHDAWAHIEHYPRASFVVLDAAGHNVHLEQPTITETLMAEWLDRVATLQ